MIENKEPRNISRREFIKITSATVIAVAGGFTSGPLINYIRKITSETSPTPAPVLIPTRSLTPAEISGLTQTVTHVPTPTETISPTITPDTLAQLALEYATEESIEINGQRRYLPTGLLLPEINFTHKIVQQPPGNPAWVSHQDFTAFISPEYYSAHGVLADYVGGLGALLQEKLHPEDDVFLFLGNGTYTDYQITEKVTLQALSPQNPYGNFRYPATGETLSVGDVFKQFYAQKDRLTIQTCSADANFRIFYVGIPPTS